MTVRQHTTYTFERGDHSFPLPFEPEQVLHVWVSPNGLKAVLGALDRDTDASDPFEAFDEFFQFDCSRAHDARRPELEDWKRIIRANPGRVVSVDSCGYGFNAGELVTSGDTRNFKSHRKGSLGDSCRAETILDRMAGYYIAPDDVTDAASYAQGAIQQYSDWCEGEVYGVAVWTYERADIDGDWPDPERDECWGYYGEDYAEEELRRQFDEAVKNQGGDAEETEGY